MSLPPWISASLPLPSALPDLGSGCCWEEDGEGDEPVIDPADLPDKTAAGLQAALKAEREKRQASEKRLQDLEAAEATRARAAAEKSGEFEKLYTETTGKLTAAQERLAELERRESKRLDSLKVDNKAALESLPKEWQELLPAGLDPEETSSFLRKLKARLATEEEAMPAGGRSRPPKSGAETIPPECEAEALKHKRDPKYWYETVWKPREAKKAAKLKK